MKIEKLFFSLIFSSVFYLCSAQTEDFDYSVEWSVGVFDEDFKGFPNRGVEATIIYKNKDGDQLYKEDHSGTLNEASLLVFEIGKGDNSEGELNYEIARDVRKLCYELMVDTDQGVITITHEQSIGSTSRAGYAAHAGGLDGDVYEQGDTSFPRWVKDSDESFMFYRQLNPNGRYTLNRGPSYDNLFKSSDATTQPTGEPISITQFLPNDPFNLFTNVPTNEPSEISSYDTRHYENVNVLHGLEIHIESVAHDQPTAGLFSQNLLNNGTGALFQAGNYGSFNEGNIGVFGVSTGDQSGYGAFFNAGDTPAEGQVKAGICATDNNIPAAWGLVVFGRTSLAFAPIIGSDAKLKRDIRPFTGSLQAVMQLNPKTYYYLASKDEKLQRGFIAQELAEVLPDLVTNVRVPDANIRSMGDKIGGIKEHLGVDYIGIIPVLTQAIQELNKKVDEQKEEIGELRTLTIALENRLLTLEEKE